MEIFKEQLVTKLPDKHDQIRKVLIILASISLAILIFVLLMGTAFAAIGLVLAGLALYGGYYLLTAQMIEYEYILTNGEIDIDKIVARRSRKRLATIKLNTAKEFGEVDVNLKVSDNETLVKADANDPEQKDYYVRVNHKSLGETVLVFTPSEEMLELVKESLPRALRYRR